jgi:hypothetical protein
MGPSLNAAGWVSTNSAAMTGSTYVYNNIFFNASNDIGGAGVTSDYNAYNYTTLGGYSWNSSEKHSFTFTGTPFVSIPPLSQPVGTIGDFHLTAAVQAQFQHGLALATDGSLNKDLDGNTRGTGGFWYIGAYQYQSGQAQPTPITPNGLRITTGG